MRRYVFRIGIWVTIMLSFLLMSSSALAQSRSVSVIRRDGDITIFSNGDVRVLEIWEVDFRGEPPFKFAFRGIPLNKVTDITNWGVREGGQSYTQSSFTEQPFTYVLSTENGERKITWYFTPALNEVRTFEVSYTQREAVGIYDDVDQFFLKFIESSRGYRIDSSRVLVHLPGNFGTDQLELATFFNISETNEGRVIDGQTVEYQSGPFFDSDEWEIGVNFPHGMVSASPPAWQTQGEAEALRAQQIKERQGFYDLLAIVATIIFLIAGGLGLYFLWYVFGRDKPVGVVAEYYPRPPENISPGVAGTLIDEKADIGDVIATLVDLARRGFLRMEEHDKPKIGRRADFTFIKSDKNEASLRSHEKVLLKAVFGRRKERKLSNLRNKFFTSLRLWCTNR